MEIDIDPNQEGNFFPKDSEEYRSYAWTPVVANKFFVPRAVTSDEELRRFALSFHGLRYRLTNKNILPGRL